MCIQEREKRREREMKGVEEDGDRGRKGRAGNSIPVVGNGRSSV